MVQTQVQTSQIDYPAGDDLIMETNQHSRQFAYLMDALTGFFEDRPDVFVGGNTFVYYKEDGQTKFLGPDLFVALGVRPQPGVERSLYRIWEEGVPPTVIIELTSESTKKVDTDEKPIKYAKWGVREYYLFDLLGTMLDPVLQGYRLNAAGQYEPLSGGEFDSPALGLRLLVRDGRLRLFNPVTGAFLPTARESMAIQAALEQEHAALRAAEAEIARLRAEIERLHGSSLPGED